MQIKWETLDRYPKILTVRLQEVIGKLVDHAQSGFIPGRQILDSILLVAELVKRYTRQHNSPRCMIKVDMRKAYDSVEWFILRSIMEELGFPGKCVNWFITCVTTVSFAILVNGVPLKSFKAAKGLRQGDPLSPYLFALCMEYLSRLVRDSSKDPKFAFHPRCRKVGITHSLFADDLLLFCRADPSFVAVMMHTFHGFSRASGLEVNEGKSSAFILGATTNSKKDVLDILSMPEGAFPFRYLGVPLHSKKLNIHDCRLLVDKILGRIKFWSSKLLSYAGRVQLVRFVFGAIKNFCA